MSDVNLELLVPMTEIEIAETITAAKHHNPALGVAVRRLALMATKHQEERAQWVAKGMILAASQVQFAQINQWSEEDLENYLRQRARMIREGKEII